MLDSTHQAYPLFTLDGLKCFKDTLGCTSLPLGRDTLFTLAPVVNSNKNNENVHGVALDVANDFKLILL